MSLMFFLSGLFVGPSLAKRGAWGFARARAWRLGLPLVLGALLLMPPSYYAWALSAGAKTDLLTYWRWSIFSQPLFPLGPLWFLLVLLVFDLTAAILYWLAPGSVAALSRATSRAARHPLRFCVALVACGTVAYFPLLMIFGPNWILIGRLVLGAPLPAVVKMLTVFACALALSWSITALARRLWAGGGAGSLGPPAAVRSSEPGQ